MTAPAVLFGDLISVLAFELGFVDSDIAAWAAQDRLIGDLGFDSLDLFVVNEVLASRFGVRLPEQLDWSVATLGDVHHYLRIGLTPD